MIRRARPLAVLLPVCVLLLLAGLAADEGQWLPEQLKDFDWAELRARGLELEPAEIWNGEEGLLSAAVKINGCSASFVSPDGLVLTNHHCGYRAVNRLSTPERNLLRDGFIAGTRQAELPAPGYRVSIVRRIEDVTAAVHAAADAAGDDPRERYEAMRRKVRELVAEGEREPHTSVLVTDYYDGREWRRIYRSEYPDVRLVYAPPAAIGEYGGDVDNWMWPRHTGDFTFFRAYSAADGSPADYSPGNVPLHPRRWLEVSREGVAEGDLVMILGYPGRTQRYLSSLAVEAAGEFTYPARLRLYSRLIAALEFATAGDAGASLRVASAIKSHSNRRKNAEGMLWGLERNGVLARKRAEEAEFRDWVAADSARQERYGGVLDALLELDLEAMAWQHHDFALDNLVRRSALMRAAVTLARLEQEWRKPDLERLEGYQERDLPGIRSQLQTLGASLVPEAEAGVLAVLLDETLAVPPEERIQGVVARVPADVSAAKAAAIAAERLVGSTAMTEDAGRMRALEAALAGEPLGDDPLLDFARGLLPELDAQRARRNTLAGRRVTVGTLWIEAQEAWRGDRFYPDANGTLRVSVAEVKSYSPRDGVLHTPFTTVDGLVAKHRGTAPFDAPAPLRRGVEQRDFGDWAAEELDSVPTCFLSDGDTTGGNSGSSVVDGRGRLVGLNFDRVFENVVGDFGWNPARSRNISVDARYILWLLDRVYPAPELLREMGVARE